MVRMSCPRCGPDVRLADVTLQPLLHHARSDRPAECGADPGLIAVDVGAVDGAVALLQGAAHRFPAAPAGVAPGLTESHFIPFLLG